MEAIRLANKYPDAWVVVVSTLPLKNNAVTLADWEARRHADHLVDPRHRLPVCERHGIVV